MESKKADAALEFKGDVEFESLDRPDLNNVTKILEYIETSNVKKTRNSNGQYIILEKTPSGPAYRVRFPSFMCEKEKIFYASQISLEIALRNAKK